MTSQNYDYFVTFRINTYSTGVYVAQPGFSTRGVLCLSQGNTCGYIISGVCVEFPQLRNITRYLGDTETVVFSVVGSSPLYTLLIATKEAIYKVPVNNSVTPPIYGHETKLITGKLIRINNNNTVFL